jgi:preprotein translocase subunit SecF
MELFRIRRDIPFMRHAMVFNIISAVTFVLAVFFLVTKGLNLSIEFTGGVVVEAGYTSTANPDGVRKSLEAAGIGEPQVQNFGTSRDILVRLALKDLKNEKIATDGKFDKEKFTLNALAAGGEKPEVKRVEFVGPQVGKELAENGAMALLVVIIGIMIYLAFRFEWKFSVAAIVANLHDIVIIAGFFAFFQWEFSLAVLAAMLAILGYSVNESVVIADRIRENFIKMRKAGVDQVIDNAITSTISRTMITHGTTLTMVLSMLIFGGPTLHYFAVALTIGICFGIYSSVLVMAPITKWLGISREDLIKPVKKDDPAQEVITP